MEESTAPLLKAAGDFVGGELDDVSESEWSLSRSRGFGLSWESGPGTGRW